MGNIGDKNISINDGNFFIVLYCDQTNSNRGWNLGYRLAVDCDNSDNWFIANRSGRNTWNTPTHQQGCPDSHIHVARREDYIDGVNTIVQVLDDNNTVVQESQKSFYFIDVPNLAPNETSFITPTPGSTYDGNLGGVENKTKIYSLNRSLIEINLIL